MAKKNRSSDAQAELTKLYQKEADLEQELIQVRHEIDRLERSNDDFNQRHEADMKKLAEIEQSLSELLNGWKLS
ncbi:hypothetical protein [Sporolactobacillus spathodeae]|uniref:Nucleic acid-binding Zn-ribbon protein n=1 Tax=Sporolactobacillus spathodeae TaxID=1465502 RepID=A0ABS2QAW4_9BACL|nr:hypothetical protein [Sporolactobacillus spathodeae]MBM7658107.1 putative nucleic acid-binding Zn-ribbon protein [Sporolactobacillus spathodeae]